MQTEFSAKGFLVGRSLQNSRGTGGCDCARLARTGLLKYGDPTSFSRSAVRLRAIVGVEELEVGTACTRE